MIKEVTKFLNFLKIKKDLLLKMSNNDNNLSIQKTDQSIKIIKELTLDLSYDLSSELIILYKTVSRIKELNFSKNFDDISKAHQLDISLKNDELKIKEILIKRTLAIKLLFNDLKEIFKSEDIESEVDEYKCRLLQEDIIIKPEIIEEKEFIINESCNTMQSFIIEDFISFVKLVNKKIISSPDSNSSLNNTKIFSIMGSAGTGKTWLVSEIIRYLLHLELSISATTPTHKALSVITKMLKKSNFDKDVDISTIFSFLNLKLDHGFGKDGNSDNVTRKPKLIHNKYNECLVSVDVLIIDESSMISNELYQFVNQVIDERCKIVLFVGDRFQLKPVEGEENKIFLNHDIRHYSLTETVRQKENSSIIKYANLIRDYIEFCNYPISINNLFVNTEEIQLVNDAEFLELFFKDTSDKIVGSYTNSMVDQYNKYIRYIDTGIEEYLAEDDIVVFQAPYTDSQGNVIFQNGESVTIQSTYKKVDSSNLTYWRCKGNHRFFNILDPISDDSFKEQLDELVNSAKASTGYKKTKYWKEFFKLQSKFGKIKYSYASTLHKLQGSTYDTMYFDMRDLSKFYQGDKDTILRLIYVAITRASKKLIILQ